jgi:phosphoribosyl-ATP pyrophosphohydrolase
LVLARENVLELADEFARFHEVAVIDLDAARGRKDNLALVKELCRRIPCRVGGGIRTPERGRDLLRAGARRIIVGTRADADFLSHFRPEQVMAAVDFRGGEVVTHGWQVGAGEGPAERIRRLAGHCSGFLATDVDREGMLQGARVERFIELARLAGKPMVAAGGITTVDEVVALDRAGIDCQVGMAVYTGRIALADAFPACVDFGKAGGLVPTVTQDRCGQVLMLAYSSPESLREALDSGRGVYYSRSRREIWRKGATSGNVQKLLRAAPDCDRDALLFTVEQAGPACHTGRASCFADAEFSARSLYDLLRERIRAGGASSYTARLAADPGLLARKIDEEASEVAQARGREEIVWEAADLAYHVLVLLAREGVAPEEVLAELGGRRR